MDAPARSGRRQLLLAVLGGVAIALCTATIVVAFAAHELDRWTESFNHAHDDPLGDVATPTRPGEPQTLLLIGSDRRYVGGELTDRALGHDDARPARPQVESMSILNFPRDLVVDIPGHGSQPINQAFALGGEKLALQTVKQLTGITPNYLVPVNFKGFEELVNVFGGVWVEVDRRYYNKNLGTARDGLRRHRPAARLPAALRRPRAGLRARAALRQRRRAGRAPAGLRARAEGAAGDQRPVRGPRRARPAARLARADRHPRDPRDRPAAPARGAERGQARRAGRLPGHAGRRRRPVRARPAERAALGGPEVRRPGAGGSARRAPRARHRASAATGLEDAAAPGREEAAALRAQTRMPILFPARRLAGSTYVGPSRGPIRSARRTGAAPRTGSCSPPPASASSTASRARRGPRAPILEDPDRTVRRGGRRLELHLDGRRIRRVVVRTRTAAYWVSNTLSLALDDRQMLAIAASLR